jgi:hypothetical protein
MTVILGATGYISGSTGYNFDGGNSSNQSSLYLADSSTSGNVLPPGGSAEFLVNYAIIAPNKTALKRVNLTFADFNDPVNVRFYNTAINVAWQKYTEETLNLVSFFHPIQNFSNYQKQTFNIPARSSINFDIGNFDETFGEVSLMMVQAEYLPHLTEDPYNVIYWNYKNSPRYVMGEFMVLSGAVKTSSNWYGWQVDPSLEPGYDGTTPGFIFTNPTEYTVRISILTAN